ncbi:MAG: transposase [Candidatus Electrothrix sp. GW3-4]|uniref:transposase n=1 Tax=Candidatus Electrothrix sp. GW3-4 TaxID=3126740 RepID=UPI0030D2D1F5
MPRSARIVLPHTPHHIVQRGHNRQAVFTSDDDYNYYLENLTVFKQEFGCGIYAYCLMTNHVHLIVDPGRSPGSLALLMKRVAGRQTRYINKREERSGSLWEGRYKSSIISAQEYLPACCRYIELNPLRAGMVTDPAQYQWSSYGAKVYGRRDTVVDLPQFYLSLGDTEQERQTAYKKYVFGTVPEHEIKLIREAVQRGQLTGTDRFRGEIEKKLGIRLSNKKQGRPGRKK